MKFILVLYLCSHIPGNSCQDVYLKDNKFNNYTECTIAGYDRSLYLMKEFDKNFVEDYKVFLVFDCKEHNTI